METHAHRPTVPLDTTNPAVQEFLALVRLQVLTPVSLLVNIAAVAVCTFVVHPTIPEVWRAHPTPLTPNAHVIGAYVAVLYLMQLGYCLLLLMVSKAETKVWIRIFKILTCFADIAIESPHEGCGLLAHHCQHMHGKLGCSLGESKSAIVSISDPSKVMGFFIAATVFQGIILLALLYSNISLFIYHPPSNSRALDVALIHAPIRFFVVLPLNILFSLTLLCVVQINLLMHRSLIFISSVAINFNSENRNKPPHDQHNASAPLHLLQSSESVHSVVAFGVLLGVNVLELVAIILQHDVVLCLAATWTAVSLWTATPKPSIVFVRRTHHCDQALSDAFL